MVILPPVFEHAKGLFKPDDWETVANWLRTNPLLSKKQIGEYIADRKNPDLLKGICCDIRRNKYSLVKI